jgi:hypothetical protein
MRRVWVLAALALGCSSGSPAPTPIAPVSSTAPPPASTATPPPSSAPLVAPVDLLHAVPATITVSSAYHDDAAQIAHLADGDLSTAWNSRTGDLVGAWIEVVVPDDASVTSIEMTCGFTREGGATDLFTGNHRIARVRVSYRGEDRGEHALDIASRAMQSLPIMGLGGAYRIEVIAIEPGTRPDWQETCVSELRVMGRAPNAHEGTLAPSTSIAAASDAGVEPTDDEPDFDAIEEALTRLALAWPDYEQAYSSGTIVDAGADAVSMARRTAILEAATLVEMRSPDQAALLRARAARSYPDWDGDLAAVITAVDAMFATLSGLLQCSWAQDRVELRLDHAQAVVEVASHVWFLMNERREDVDGHRYTAEEIATAQANLDAADAFDEWLGHVEERLDGTNRAYGRAAQELRTRTPPAHVFEHDDWEQLLGASRAAAATCAPFPDE